MAGDEAAAGVEGVPTSSLALVRVRPLLQHLLALLVAEGAHQRAVDDDAQVVDQLLHRLAQLVVARGVQLQPLVDVPGGLVDGGTGDGVPPPALVVDEEADRLGLDGHLGQRTLLPCSMLNRCAC